MIYFFLLFLVCLAFAAFVVLLLGLGFAETRFRLSMFRYIVGTVGLGGLFTTLLWISNP